MSDDLPCFSGEVLAAVVVSLREELIATRVELERALTRIAELEARLAANFGNSGKPPSSDGLAKRGTRGIDDLGVLTRFRGVAVHDAWAPYDTYLDPQHQLCCAHALRELQAVADTAPTGQRRWATQAANALVAMQTPVNETAEDGRDSLDTATLAEQVHRHRSAARIGIGDTAARTGQPMKKHNALARRLIDRQDDYLRFTHDWRIPPDNNGSEHDIRMIKLRQKVSGCQRTLARARQFCAIRSHLSTAAKHGMHFFDVLVMLADGHPWMPATA